MIKCTFSILLHCKASYMTVYLAQSFLIHSNFKVTSERMLSRYSLLTSATSALLCCSNLSWSGIFLTQIKLKLATLQNKLGLCGFPAGSFKPEDPLVSDLMFLSKGDEWLWREQWSRLIKWGVSFRFLGNSIPTTPCSSNAKVGTSYQQPFQGRFRPWISCATACSKLYPPRHDGPSPS